MTRPGAKMDVADYVDQMIADMSGEDRRVWREYGAKTFRSQVEGWEPESAGLTVSAVLSELGGRCSCGRSGCTIE